MRVLLTVHHPLDPNQGAPGVTLALAGALERAGCDVTTYGFGEAWPRRGEFSVRHAVTFPYRTAAYVVRNRGRFDVLDMSTGDAHWWPLARCVGGRRPLLITRSHGLEHLADERVRADAERGTVRLRRRYTIYHGGLRLREVARSLRAADGVVVTNDVDRDYVISRIGVPGERVIALPNGVPAAFIDAPRSPLAEGPLRLAWIARWESAKGSLEMAQALDRVVAQGVELQLLMLGTGVGEDAVLASLSERVRPCVAVRPRFLNAELPALLADRDVFVFPSHSEGFSVALVEAMALGLAPLTTAVGGAPKLIVPGVNGVVIPTHDAAALADAIAAMAADRTASAAMGAAARATASDLTWDVLARRTLQWYEHVRALAVR